jgi:integrase
MSKTKSKPGVRPLGDNRYAIRATLVDSVTKQRKEIKRVITAGNLREADAARDVLLAELERPAVAKEARMTVSDYAVRWLTLRRPLLRPGTAHRYRLHLDRFIAALGGVWIDDLTPRMVTDWLAQEAKTLSGVTCLNALRVVRTMTKDATSELRLPAWPCDRVRAPKPVEVYDDEENALNPEDLARLFHAMRSTELRMFPLFAFMAYTGTRYCEAHALEWADLDFEASTVLIVRSRYQKALGPPKTRGSKRHLSLPPELVDILRQHRAGLLRTQNPGLARNLVFPTTTGSYQDNAGLNHAIHRATKVAGIAKHFSAHGLRRTMNTLALKVAPAEAVRKLLGHTTAGMTTRYLAVDIDQKRAIADGVATLVRDATRDVEGRVEGWGIAPEGRGPSMTEPAAMT